MKKRDEKGKRKREEINRGEKWREKERRERKEGRKEREERKRFEKWRKKEGIK